MLTPRQVEVLIFMRDGLSNKQIAMRLGVSTSTVANHIKSIGHRLNAQNRTLMVVKALRHGVIDL